GGRPSGGKPGAQDQDGLAAKRGLKRGERLEKEERDNFGETRAGSKSALAGRGPDASPKERGVVSTAQATELKSAWIVTQGRQARLYVLEGTQVTVSPLPARAEDRSQGKDKNEKGLTVTSLRVMTRSLTAKRRPVDLRQLDQREELLAIARLEMSEASPPREQTRRGRSKKSPAKGRTSPTGVVAGEEAPGGGKAQGAGEAPLTSTAKRKAKRVRSAASEAQTKRSAHAGRAALVLRLLGALDPKGPATPERLRQALVGAERRQRFLRRARR
ncbi:MAG: hypothetical protein JKY65_25390, partial [Planctomycetes bacterium]|nr:hypothetical protein [Planctomycetota bacterium]